MLKCTLNNKQLMEKVVSMTKTIQLKRKVLTNQTSPNPNNDFDLLVIELINRFGNSLTKDEWKAKMVNWGCYKYNDNTPDEKEILERERVKDMVLEDLFKDDFVPKWISTNEIITK